MKNHIVESIFETAATLPNTEGEAAINQLLTEASAQFPEVEPNGYSVSGNTINGKPYNTYYLHTKLTNPWPLEHKLFCGFGDTPKGAYAMLLQEMGAWFNSLNCGQIFNHEGEDITDAFCSQNETSDIITDRRYAFPEVA